MENNSKLIIITGPMFAGKTTMLIREAQKALNTNKKVILFRSAIDDRYSISDIVSHDGEKIAAVTLPDGEDGIATLGESAENYEIIFIDEGHFWKKTKGFAAALRDVASRSGITVYVALLNTDIDGRPFKIAEELIALADTAHYLKARCVKCGNVATLTQKVIGGVENFDVSFMPGGSNLYQARCDNCFVRPEK